MNEYNQLSSVLLAVLFFQLVIMIIIIIIQVVLYPASEINSFTHFYFCESARGARGRVANFVCVFVCGKKLCLLPVKITRASALTDWLM